MSTLALVAPAGPAARRHAARLCGPEGAPPLVLGHGFGTDQGMWGRAEEALAADHRVLLFDHLGAGSSDLTAYSARRHVSLEGYAADLVVLLEELDLGPVAYVGHSAGAMIGTLAAVQRPDLFSALALVGGSPRYLDDPADGYVGGFGRADVDGLLEAMEANYLAWSQALAPVVMGNPDRPELTQELAASFARTESRIALEFARAIFLSDHRAVLRDVDRPTLVVQAAEDPMVPESVAHFLHEQLPGSRLELLAATGHFPQVSGADETVAVLRDFLDGPG
ncbi:MAG: alpha/beta hydrolase [Frankiales bacterium]|nr:alpha/beta hydrolase [Frankiales bacterium]